ncbi:hypothetical protein C8R34_10136 [Nitrosomonas sp. Nm84]|uniref:hypothetical protein n=1 Tax=Nitrosomonas sp. Nm84 TaxID=200124 RepID=UPI000D7555DB|nr:hypothetical protein [Nitrosomonas sp. Nm84]PXW91127.1 hypothetical protein C8R34_10136 [Nitrosomonas sp. Nm84]
MAIIPLDRVAIAMFDRRVFLTMLLLLASIAMAETRLKLSFPDEFYREQQLSDSEFNRGTQSKNEPKAKARQWREHADESSKGYRWKGAEFHYAEHNKQHPQTIPDSQDRISAPQIELERQFELRF